MGMHNPTPQNTVVPSTGNCWKWTNWFCPSLFYMNSGSILGIRYTIWAFNPLILSNWPNRQRCLLKHVALFQSLFCQAFVWTLYGRSCTIICSQVVCQQLSSAECQCSKMLVQAKWIYLLSRCWQLILTVYNLVALRTSELSNIACTAVRKAVDPVLIHGERIKVSCP